MQPIDARCTAVASPTSRHKNKALVSNVLSRINTLGFSEFAIFHVELHKFRIRIILPAGYVT